MPIPRCQCQYIPMSCKICCINNHNNVAQKLKETTDIEPNKFESEENWQNIFSLLQMKVSTVE